MNSFLESVRERARQQPRRLVFPEGDDERTRLAVAELARDGLAQPVLVVGAEDPEEGLAAGVEIVRPATDARLGRLAGLLWERRRARGLTPEQALELAVAPLMFGALLVSAGEVDGSVAGAANATGDVLRAAFWAVGTAQGTRTVSSTMYMLVPPFRGGEAEVLSFADCAVVPHPTAGQLADIAVAAALARRRVVGDEPRVAFLSFSTAGSAEDESVTRIRDALERFRQREPHITADGELQADAALVESVARRKAPGSALAGGANVLIFPDLNAGNIAYKLVQRLAGADAIGPVIQGLRRPCNDLSRGATAEDIVNVACITALLAG